MAGIKKVFSIGDLHYPDHINFKPTLEFLKVWKPNILIFGGDCWDLGYLSHWSTENFKNIGFDTINQRLLREAGEVHNLLKSFVVASGAKEVYYIQGNHEKWVDMYIDKYPQVMDFSIKTLLKLKSLGIKYVPMEGNVKIGKRIYVHGQQYGTENPCKQAIGRSRRNIAMFHHHKDMNWPGFSDLDVKDHIKAVAIPCFCNRAPDYLKGRSNQWSCGFDLALVKKSGNFSSYVVEVSPQGNFITPDGHEWK